MEEKIALALASDGNYFCGLFVTAASIARFADAKVELVFNILDGGISDEDWTYFVSRVKGLHKESEFRRIRLDEDRFAGFASWHGSKMTYARLLLPSLLPNDEFVVYCDVDFLWMDDVAKLWALRDRSVPLMSVPDVNETVKGWERAWFEGNGMVLDMTRYFCAGLILFNLRLFRAESLAEKSLAFIDAYHPPMNDQAALNEVVKGRHVLLPIHWQLYSRDSPIESFVPPFVLHYAGDIPWKISKRSHMLTDVQLLWFVFDASIRGISAWRSLRRYYSACEIVFYRVTFKMVMGFPPLKATFDALMRKLGRWGFYEKLPPRMLADLKRACCD